jgi:8-oxo-dGTP diphosphatase
MHVVVGILQREDKLLVAQRPADKSHAGYWEFAGGKVEINETSWDALVRELYEELGVQVIAGRYWDQNKYGYPDKSVLLEVWLVEKFSGEPQGKEGQRLCWVTIPELLELRLLEGNWRLVDKLKNLFT